jgi:hypothetical protein
MITLPGPDVEAIGAAAEWAGAVVLAAVFCSDPLHLKGYEVDQVHGFLSSRIKDKILRTDFILAFYLAEQFRLVNTAFQDKR